MDVKHVCVKCGADLEVEYKYGGFGVEVRVSVCKVCQDEAVTDLSLEIQDVLNRVP